MVFVEISLVRGENLLLEIAEECTRFVLCRAKDPFSRSSGFRTMSYDALRTGELEAPSDDYRLITGKDPLTVADVIARHVGELP